LIVRSFVGVSFVAAGFVVVNRMRSIVRSHTATLTGVRGCGISFCV
jgi:hypothetical protein